MRKQFAVIGNPIEQSRSPELHHAFAKKTGHRTCNTANALRRLMVSATALRTFLAMAA